MKYKNIELTDWEEGHYYLGRRNEKVWGDLVGFYIDKDEKYWVLLFAWGIFKELNDLLSMIYPNYKEIKFVRGKEDQQAKDFMDQFLLRVDDLKVFL